MDGRIYYAKSNVDRFLGMIVLRGAYVQQDSQKKSGKDFCFFVISEFDKRTYYLAAETKEEMETWIKVIQDKINELSFA